MAECEGRVLSLDGLRGLGALLVFLYHIDIMVHPFDEGGGSELLSRWSLCHGVLYPVRCRTVPCPV